MEKESNKNEMTEEINHIVLSGGGHIGITQYSILNELHKKEFYKIDNIKSIYAASAGAIVAVILCLKHDYDEVIKYILDRPWQNSIEFTISNVLNFYQEKGVFGEEIFSVILKSLLSANDLTIESTLLDLFNKSNIQLNIFATKMEDFTPYRINYLTHPNIPIITAVHMSASIPFVFKPVFYDNQCFMDGGIIINYPLECCINDQKCSTNSILAINNNIQSAATGIHKINHSSNIIDIFMMFFSHYNVLRQDYKKQIKCDNVTSIPFEIQTYSNGVNLNDLFKCVIDRNKRVELINDGIMCVDIFYKYLKNFLQEFRV